MKAYWRQTGGLVRHGQNPAVGASNGRLERKAPAKLKGLVVRDMAETETASFWCASPEVDRGELSPPRIATEVFLVPQPGLQKRKAPSPARGGFYMADWAADFHPRHTK
jgi:hypothetical protein